MSKLDQFERYYAKDRKEWRKWLENNHATSQGIWLIYYKKCADKTCVSYDEAVEEALSFGWIDSKVNKLDDERYMQVFTPRKPKSIWSKLNKQRVQKIIEQGLMTPAGLEKIETAKKPSNTECLGHAKFIISLFRKCYAFPSTPKNSLNFLSGWILELPR